MEPGEVNWRQRVGEGAWQDVVLRDGVLELPEALGAYSLEARWSEGGERERSRVWRFVLGTSPDTVKVLFGTGSGEVSRGEAEAERESGRIYGFSAEHGDRLRSYSTAQRGEWGWEPGQSGTYIALGSGQAFRMHVGVGRRKVRVVVGTLEGAETELRIGGKTFILSSEEERSLYEIVTEIDVTDGLLRLRGSPGLPLLEWEVEELTTRAPTTPETVRRLPGVLLSGPGDGNEK